MSNERSFLVYKKIGSVNINKDSLKSGNKKYVEDIERDNYVFTQAYEKHGSYPIMCIFSNYIKHPEDVAYYFADGDEDVVFNIDKQESEKNLFSSWNVIPIMYRKYGVEGCINKLKEYGFDGSFVMYDVKNKCLVCACIGEKSKLYYGYDSNSNIMFSNDKDVIINNSVNKECHVLSNDVFCLNNVLHSITSEYGDFLVMKSVFGSEPFCKESMLENDKTYNILQESAKSNGKVLEGKYFQQNQYNLIGLNSFVYSSLYGKYSYIVNCSNPERLKSLINNDICDDTFKENRPDDEEEIIPKLYDRYGIKFLIDYLNKNGINCSFVIMNCEDGSISAGKSGTSKLYYTCNKSANLVFSSNPEFLSCYDNEVIEFGDKYYNKGEFCKLDDKVAEKEESETKGEEEVERDVIKETKSLNEELPKEMMDFINDIISGNISDEVRDKIKKSLQEYLNSDEIKSRIESSVSGSIDTETKKELLKIVRNEVEKSGYKESVRKEISEEVEKIISEEKKKLNLPTIHIINLHGEEIGRTDAEHFHEKFEEILSLVNMDEPVMLIGPAGSGKNYSIAQVSKALNKHMYYTNNASNEFKLTGFIDAGGNYRDTEFYKAFKNGGVFFLDEIDNSDPSALIVINSALANGYMAFPHETIDRHPDFRMVAAANTWGRGSDFQYVGRNALDASTLDRFDNVFFDYDMALEEKLYPNDSVLDFMWAFRDAVEKSRIPHIVSTRGIGKVYKKEISGFSPETTLRVNVIRNLSQDDLNVILGNMEKLKNNKYYEACKKLIIK